MKYSSCYNFVNYIAADTFAKATRRFNIIVSIILIKSSALGLYLKYETNNNLDVTLSV